MLYKLTNPKFPPIFQPQILKQTTHQPQRKGRPCATRKPQLLLYPRCNKPRFILAQKEPQCGHNVVCFETTYLIQAGFLVEKMGKLLQFIIFLPKEKLHVPKSLHGWNPKMVVFWKRRFFVFESHHLQVPVVSFSEGLWHDYWFLPNMWMTIFSDEFLYHIR